MQTKQEYRTVDREFIVIQGRDILFRSKVQSAACLFVEKSGRGQVLAAFVTKNVTLKRFRRE